MKHMKIGAHRFSTFALILLLSAFVWGAVNSESGSGSLRAERVEKPHKSTVNMNLRASIELQSGRGGTILKSFGKDPAQYLCVVEWNVKRYLSGEDSLFAWENSEPHPGDTIPVYFISKDGQTIYSVKQELYGLNYLYTFVRDEGGSLTMAEPPQCVQSDVLFVDPSALPRSTLQYDSIAKDF